MKTFVLLLVLGLAACREKPPAESPAPAVPAAAIPVQIAPAARASLSDVVSGSGHTAALVQEKIRAPFPGTLTELSVADGDRVRRGDTLGTVVARDSEAALSGARQMGRDASTDTAKQDAARALELAEQGLVRAPILAPADGLVLAHAAARGDRLSDEQEILTIADTSSIVFLVDVTQSDLARVRPGQSVLIEVPGRTAKFSGTVHDVLPGANATDFTVPVRVDLHALSGVPPLGLFGTARITVTEHRDATVVPDAAIVRDDLAGTSRIALVQDGRAHWIDVTSGLRGAAGTEITAPPIAPGQAVVVAGQVGLPEGAAVAARP